MFIPEQLYKEIVKVIPVACVDLLVLNKNKEALMVKRKNEPAFGQWWFPGGRIHFGETRKNAAIRKLWEECGLRGTVVKEIGTYDLFLKDKFHNNSHAITTVFKIDVNDTEVKIDSQSDAYKWGSPNNIIENCDSFIRQILEIAVK